MLLYSNYTFWRIVFCKKGTLIYRWQNLLTGSCVGLVTLLLVLMRDHEILFLDKIEPPSPLGWNMMGSTIVFAVVFRTHLGWQRYWEAMTHLQAMYSKWTDAYTQANAFFNVAKQLLQETSPEHSELKRKLLSKLQRRLRDRFSLMSAMAAHRLTHGDVQRMDRRAASTPWEHQIVLRRNMRIGEDLTGATSLPGFVKTEDVEVINCPTQLSNTWEGTYTVLGEVTAAELELLGRCSDRVNCVMYWIDADLAMASSHLSIAAPIQSRIYQEMSNGALAYSNAMKISDVPFPFQFSQLFNLLVCAFTVFIPLYSAVFTNSFVLSPILAFVVHQTLCVINHVACELETPFGIEDNDISLRDFHSRFLELILELDWSSEFKSLECIDDDYPLCGTLDGCLAAAGKKSVASQPKARTSQAGVAASSGSAASTPALVVHVMVEEEEEDRVQEKQNLVNRPEMPREGMLALAPQPSSGDEEENHPQVAQVLAKRPAKSEAPPAKKKKGKAGKLPREGGGTDAKSTQLDSHSNSFLEE